MTKRLLLAVVFAHLFMKLTIDLTVPSLGAARARDYNIGDAVDTFQLGVSTTGNLISKLE